MSHWDWRVSGCCLEELESRNCLAGLRDVGVLINVSASLVEEVSYETLVLRTLMCEFLRKSRAKRFVRNARIRDLTRNPLLSSCMSSVRTAGESAMCPMRVQPSAEISTRRRESARNPLQRSRLLSARNAGGRAIRSMRSIWQPGR